MKFYNIENVPKNINYPDIYFTPEYGKACEFSDNAIWELCQYKDLIYVYLKKEYIFEEETYYDLVTPYGYAGYYFENQETYNEFIPLFRIEAKNKNYLTEVVRQNPYLNINISAHYEIITSKTIFSVEIDNYDFYYNKILKSSARNKLKKSTKDNYSYEIIDLKPDTLNKYFINLYNITMNKVNASKYYYFNDKYYEQLESNNNNKLINIYNDKKELIGCSILFLYNNFVHYHLSCNNNSSNYITDYLLNSVIKYLGLGRKFIIGGGLKDNDTLYNFKKKISSDNYNYVIYKNILNKEVYDKIKKQYEFDTYFPIHRK
jgi:hypothetical protein